MQALQAVSPENYSGKHWKHPGNYSYAADLHYVPVVAGVFGLTTTASATAPPLRAVAMEPSRFENQRITLTGQFRGRNLFGELPDAPARSRYDFVLRNAEGAIWVTGIRPKGKGFDLNVDARVDTSQWLSVTGVLKRDRGLVVLEARALATAQAPARPAVAELAPKAPAATARKALEAPAKSHKFIDCPRKPRLARPWRTRDRKSVV